MSGRSPRPPRSVCLSARLLCRALPWIPTVPRQLQEEPGGAAGLLEEVAAGARRKRGGARGVSPPRRRATGCAPLRFAQTAPKCPRPGGARPSPGGGAGTGHPGCGRGGRALSGGRRLPHTRSSRGGGREGGRQSCSLTAGSLPRPLPPPPAPRSEAGTLAAAGHGSAVPLRTQAGRRWPRHSPFQRPAAAGCPGWKFPPPVSGELGPARASDSKPVLLPTGRVAVTKTRRTDTERVWSPRSRGARWGRRCGGPAAAGAPRTCSHGNFYVPSALPQCFLRF